MTITTSLGTTSSDAAAGAGALLAVIAVVAGGLLVLILFLLASRLRRGLVDAPPLRDPEGDSEDAPESVDPWALAGKRAVVTRDPADDD